MTQECDTEYFQKCSAEMKEECFEFVKLLMKYKIFPHSIPFNLFHEVLGGGGDREMRNFLILSFNHLTCKIFDGGAGGA